MTERGDDGRADAEPTADRPRHRARRRPVRPRLRVRPRGGPGVADDEPGAFVPSRGGCRTDLRGWAGAHLHGAVRPRRRAAGRGRPPGRWC